eukprot:TRINITY_DN5742_c0_g1_i1.p1 TRINITY_DN5742_c0_g1~~TRINITY_DN5742_c0_g1_i1.p1  ORF type:complete len:295 (-),score=81.88 TRINITY_DN5742_c0_g1_i1:244-1128(-)
MTAEILPTGQRVAAQVPYTKNSLEWIVASVASYEDDRGTYSVKDEYPESRKNTKFHNIPTDCVIRFPSDREEDFEQGEHVLSLWYIKESDEWSSMFYDAVVVQPFRRGDGKSVKLRFKGDDQVYDIDLRKFVKRPENDTYNKKTKKRKEPEGASKDKPNSNMNGKSRIQNGNRESNNQNNHWQDREEGPVQKKPKLENSNHKNDKSKAHPYGANNSKKDHDNSIERREKSLNEIRQLERQERNIERHSAKMKENRELKRVHFGVLGKKIKRMETILKERKDSNERHTERPQVAN